MSIHKLEHCAVIESEGEIILAFKNIQITLTTTESKRGTQVSGQYKKNVYDDHFQTFLNLPFVPVAAEVAK